MQVMQELRPHNYAQVVDWILRESVTVDNVNFAGQGNIYEINSMEITRYPLVWVSATRPATETENYWTYNLTLYYFDRLKDQCEDVNDADSLISQSNGIEALSALINKIRNSDWVYDLGYDNGYTLFSSTPVFNDFCTGVYTEISVKVPKTTIC